MGDLSVRTPCCCFTGHRPAKLTAPEDEIKAWLEQQIDQTIADGYRHFITGCAMGVDIWAGQIVLRKREENPDLFLTAAVPWAEMADRWGAFWGEQHRELVRKADEAVMISGHYHTGVYAQRNRWMVEHSTRVIAFYNGTPGGTRNTILYAKERGLEIVQFQGAQRKGL